MGRLVFASSGAEQSVLVGQNISEQFEMATLAMPVVYAMTADAIQAAQSGNALLLATGIMSTFASALMEPDSTTLSVQEVAAAIQALTDADKTAVVKIARFYSQRSQYAHEDLLQEAICRVLEGRRAWPRELSGRVFLGGVMRSIAWEWKSDLVDEELDVSDDGAAERGANAWLDAKSIVAQFNDDPLAQKIVVGMMEGLRGEELEQASGLTDTEYQSKRKKIRRRLEKMMMTVM
jgi:DNA-directed RNA polymerase specialized sigma24 family protein